MKHFPFQPLLYKKTQKEGEMVRWVLEAVQCLATIPGIVHLIVIYM